MSVFDAKCLEPWPFHVAPDESRATVWAGRPAEKQQLDRMIGRWGISPASSLHLIWADWGMGKTHCLYYAKAKAATGSKPYQVSYSALPKMKRGFIDVYEAVMRGFEIDSIARMVYEHWGNSYDALQRLPAGTIRDVNFALWNIATSRGEVGAAARAWLLGQPLTVARLRQLGFVNAVKTAGDCVRTLDAFLWVLREVAKGGPYGAIILIDEFQRIGELSRPRYLEVCDSLHTVFNHNQQSFRLLLAFASGDRENVRQILTGELYDRADRSGGIYLGPMSELEGEEFLADLLGHGGPDGGCCVFKGGVTRLIARHIRERTTLKPRSLMQAADLIVTEALLDEELPVQAQYVERLLKESRWVVSEDSSQESDELE